jgi:hypothetical protein
MKLKKEARAHGGCRASETKNNNLLSESGDFVIIVIIIKFYFLG